MRTPKTHLKYKGKALCGAKKRKRRLQFVDDKHDVTCRNCQRAARS